MHSATQDSSSDSLCEDKVLQAVLARKAKQKAKKSQPWKGVYTPESIDLPATTSPHDKPWLRDTEPEKSGPRQDSDFNWGDEGYDTDAGKT